MPNKSIANLRSGALGQVSGATSQLIEVSAIQSRLKNRSMQRPIMSAPARSTSVLGSRLTQSQSSAARIAPTHSDSIGGGAISTAEAALLDEHGSPLIGHSLAFTPDVVQVFQEAAKSIEESREIKKQTANQLKDALNDAKATSNTVSQNITEKLADTNTLTVRTRPSPMKYLSWSMSSDT